MSDSTELRFVRSTLDAMAAGSAGGSGQFGSYLTLGPAMCARLQQDAKALLGSGKPMTIAFPGPNQVTCLTVTGFHDDVVIALVESPLFIEIGRQFADAEIRAATELERHWYYMLIPFEIYGRAITVADNGESVLLVDCIDGRVFWMEMLSDWWGPNSPEGAEEIARLIGVEARGD